MPSSLGFADTGPFWLLIPSLSPSSSSLLASLCLRGLFPISVLPLSLGCSHPDLWHEPFLLKSSWPPRSPRNVVIEVGPRTSLSRMLCVEKLRKGSLHGEGCHRYCCRDWLCFAAVSLDKLRGLTQRRYLMVLWVSSVGLDCPVLFWKFWVSIYSLVSSSF